MNNFIAAKTAVRLHSRLTAFATSTGASAPATEKSYTYHIRAKDVDRKKKERIDAFLNAAVPEISRNRIKQSVLSGLVLVNGQAQMKPSYIIKLGDRIHWDLPPPQVSAAVPEDIPLNIVYEDEAVIVVNKSAGMVVHPSPGHETGTLVNALLHHCDLSALCLPSHASSAPASLGGLSAMQAEARKREKATTPDTQEGAYSQPADSDDEDDDGEVATPLLTSGVDGQQIVLRPGIVHRLDKGTTGLMVVCKDDTALTNLGAQFKSRRVSRVYWSITVGVPPKAKGTVETNIGRSPSDRKKMAAYGFGSQKGREAISTYEVIEELADGTSALVQWRLRSGRTHQIRVHAQYLGCPLLGDEDYGGVGHAHSIIGRGIKSRDEKIRPLVKTFGRPALHAKTLGFEHPFANKRMDFESELPDDFAAALEGLKTFPLL